MAIHITAVTKVKQSSLRQSTIAKHLAIINRFSADNRTIKTSHLPITFLAMYTQRVTLKTGTVLSF
jgi:hypothetical protein